MKVGFIGLGTMGNRMAGNLAKAKHDLVVHDIDRKTGDPLVADGATWADTPKAVAAASEVVFTSLPGPPEVESVAYGEDGLIAGLQPGAAWFDLSTNDPTRVRQMAARFAEKGLRMLDAPVSGGPAGAASGKLAVWVGGDKAAYDQFEPVISTFSDNARYIGEIGAGSVAKLVHNCAGHAILACLAEAMTLGVKGGVEPVALWEAIRTGAGGRSRTFDRLADQFLPGEFEKPAFALKLAHKDVTLATALGRELGVPMRMVNLALQEMTEGRNRGWDEWDSRSPMQLQVQRAGVTIKGDRDRIAEVFERDPPAPTDTRKK